MTRVLAIAVAATICWSLVIKADEPDLKNLLAVKTAARPFSGGAVTLILTVSPSQPTIPSRDDPGTTFTLRRAEGWGAFVTVPAIP